MSVFSAIAPDARHMRMMLCQTMPYCRSVVNLHRGPFPKDSHHSVLSFVQQPQDTCFLPISRTTISVIRPTTTLTAFTICQVLVLWSFYLVDGIISASASRQDHVSVSKPQSGCKVWQGPKARTSFMRSDLKACLTRWSILDQSRR